MAPRFRNVVSGCWLIVAAGCSNSKEVSLTPAVKLPTENAASPRAGTSQSAQPSLPEQAAQPTKVISPTASSKPIKELPRGGREIFPAHRLVGYCGTPGAPALGPLHKDIANKVKALEDRAIHYADGRKVLPVLELIAVVVQSTPGGDGKFRMRVYHSVVDEYLRVAREAKALLLLNIQPGRSDFLSETKYFDKYLRQPDVGLALDPEWAMKAGQIPGIKYGQTDGRTLNQVAEYLEGIVREENLPEKVLVFHQVAAHIVQDEGSLKSHPGIVIIKSVDGLGSKHWKLLTYDRLTRSLGQPIHPGFKLFFDEDNQKGAKLMTPTEVMALSPQPEYVMHE